VSFQCSYLYIIKLLNRCFMQAQARANAVPYQMHAYVFDNMEMDSN
jgi:hypothetical protein